MVCVIDVDCSKCLIVLNLRYYISIYTLDGPNNYHYSLRTKNHEVIIVTLIRVQQFGRDEKFSCCENRSDLKIWIQPNQSNFIKI
jgi:hypothetical protein